MPMQKASRGISSALCLLLVSIMALLVACTPSPTNSVEGIQGATMGTSYHIKWVTHEKAPSSKKLKAKVDALLEQVNDQMSTYRDDSELSKLNQDASGSWHQVSPELVEVLRLSQDVHQLTQGAFDVSLGPLVNLWGFGPDPDPDNAPAAETIKVILANTGMAAIEIKDGTRVRWSHPRYIDLSAIAKGYGVDRVAKLLESQGIEQYMVEIGGEIFAKGIKPGNQPWRIAVETPAYTARGVQRILAVSDWGVATSGDYRNYQEFDGKRFSHTLDPRTGYPVEHKLASVTVAAESAARADALATAILVMGEDEGLMFAKKHGIPALLIVRTASGFVELATDAFTKAFEKAAIGDTKANAIDDRQQTVQEG